MTYKLIQHLETFREDIFGKSYSIYNTETKTVGSFHFETVDFYFEYIDTVLDFQSITLEISGNIYNNSVVLAEFDNIPTLNHFIKNDFNVLKALEA